MERGGKGEGKGRAQEGKREAKRVREAREGGGANNPFYSGLPTHTRYRPTGLLLGNYGEGHTWLLPGNCGVEFRQNSNSGHLPACEFHSSLFICIVAFPFQLVSNTYWKGVDRKNRLLSVKDQLSQLRRCSVFDPIFLCSPHASGTCSKMSVI